jgi:hypothetical protein
VIRLIIIALGFVLLLNAFDKAIAGYEAKRAYLLNGHVLEETK